jgi:iron transport multicopper oxidase
MGTNAVATVSVKNVSDAPMTVSAVASPSAPFSIAGLPAAGTVLAVGDAFTATITFAPASVGSSSSFFSVTASGATAAVAVEGSAFAGGKLRIAPESLDVGLLTDGDVLTSLFQLTNTGDLPLVIEKSQPPSSPAFAVMTALPEGTIMAPGASLQELIRISPIVVGPASDVWRINANDGQGLREVTLAVTGLAGPVVAPPPGPDAGTDAMSMTVESNEPTVANEDDPGASDEVVGHACSAAGTARSPRLLGLGLVAAALVSIRRRRRQ